MTTADQARETARKLLAEALPRRWAHVQGVAGKAQKVAADLGMTEVLAAAAWLHGIGYAPGLAATGFHPLDGARYLSGLGAPERMVNLVARHSNPIPEAELRGLGDQVAAYPDEAGPMRDALWCCDLTTSPDGESVRAGDRIADIKERYGPGHIVTQFITEASPDLLAAVERTKRRLTGELAC
jgi:hypothetical protein